MPFVIRPMDARDAPALAPIIADWGYPSDERSIGARVANVAVSRSDLLRVAQADDGSLAGWIHAGEHRTLASDPVCEILGLAVDRRFRGMGVGRALVDVVRAWAKQQGYTIVQVHSNVIRPEAHPFYERLGFTRTKTQHVYRQGL
jgi:GNAT superfamily N-acetyltransferase